MSKRSQWEVYVSFTGVRKRDRKAKRHMDKIAILTEAPNADTMNELERVAKSHVQTNFKVFPNTFSLEALHFTIEDHDGYSSKTRMMFGESGDVKQTCLI